MENFKNNKIVKFIGKVIYILAILFVTGMFVFAVVQGSSNNRNSIKGKRVFTVITGSMIPVYNIGDIIVIKEVPPEELKVEDDIVYRGEEGTYRNKTITHRIEEIKKKEDGNYRIVTKGVANSARDPEINQTQVYGKVMFKIPIISLFLKLITNIYVIISIPVVLLINSNIKRIKEMGEENGR